MGSVLCKDEILCKWRGFMWMVIIFRASSEYILGVGRNRKETAVWLLEPRP